MLDAGAAHGARPRARLRRLRPHGEGHRDRRGPLRAHHRRHPARRGARRLAGARPSSTPSTSSTGTSSRRSCARPARRRRSPAKWRWSPARPPASARPASRPSSSAARRWSALDRNPAIETHVEARRISSAWPATSPTRRRSSSALDAAVKRFGGVDMLVLNAGIFPASAADPGHRAPTSWRSAMAVNVEANLLVMQACHPLLKLAPRGGRVVVIGSKNVPAPGPGAAAYSASKAALNQLARVAALEWAQGRHPHQLAASQRGVRHRAVDRRGARLARQGLRPDRRAVQEEQPAEDRGRVEGRRRAGRRDVRRRCSPRPPPRRCRSTAATSASSSGDRADPLEGRPARAARPAPASGQDRLRHLPTARPKSRRRSATWWCAARRRSAARPPSASSCRKASAELLRGAGQEPAHRRQPLLGAGAHEEGDGPARPRRDAIFDEDLAANRAMGRPRRGAHPRAARGS